MYVFKLIINSVKLRFLKTLKISGEISIPLYLTVDIVLKLLREKLGHDARYLRH